MLLKFTEDAWKGLLLLAKSGQKDIEANQYPYQRDPEGSICWDW